MTAAAALGGLAALAWPFVCPTSSWHWDLRDAAELAGARVNADLLAIDGRGALLSPQGTRPISIITPPLALPDDCGHIVSVRASLPGVPGDSPRQARVILLWQTEPVEGFSYSEKTARLSERPTTVRFSLPEEPSAVHRLGVQFPGARGPVRVRSLGLPAMSPVDRLRIFGGQVTQREPIRNHSINFLRGPSILGHTFNYFLVALLLAVVGAYGWLVTARGGRVSRGTAAAIALAVWFAADVQATWNLSRQVRGEMAEMAGLRDQSWAGQIASISGQDIAWAYVQLLEHTEPGATFAVVSDDPFTPPHRLAYLLAPQRTRRASYGNADYVVVVRAAEAVFEEARGRFRWKQAAWISAERVAAMSPGVYLLRRTHP